MEKEEALKVLVEMQKWRRCEDPYADGVPCKVPYSQKVFGKAIDVAIDVLKNTE